MITTFAALLWLNWDHGYNVFMEKATKQSLSRIFVGHIETMKTLEESLCDHTQFGFQKLFLDLDLVDSEEYRNGRALALQVNVHNPGKGWWNLFKRYYKETIAALQFNPEISNHVETTIREIAKKVTLVTKLLLSAVTLLPEFNFDG